jgi:DHA1 family tetracycline resistance protein-like MFS transporter
MRLSIAVLTFMRSSWPEQFWQKAAFADRSARPAVDRSRRSPDDPGLIMGSIVSAQGPRRAALVFIFVTIALDMMAIGLVVPVLPKLVEDFVNEDTAAAARIFGVFGVVWALMQFVSMPVMGSLSDRFGRRPVILLSNFGLGLDYILMALAPNLAWLFVGRVISGITAASISTSMAYVADVTPVEKRASAFGITGIAFGVGFVLGPALGGVLGSIDPRLPFWAAAGLSLLNGLYGLFVLPESLPPDRRRAFEWRRANPVGSLKLLRSRAGLMRLAAIAFLGNLAHAVLPSVFVLYAGFRYGWQERTVGLSLALVGVSSAVVQGALVGPLVARLGERLTLLTGLAFGIAGFLAYGIAPTGVVFLAVIPLVALWGLSGPSAQGLMTRLVDPRQQGELQGANGAVLGIAAMIGPGLFTLTFARFISADQRWQLPGAPFFLAALLLAIAWLIGLNVSRAPQAGR